MKNFHAVGQGSTAAEKVEVVEEFKVQDGEVKPKAEEATGNGDVKAPEVKWVELSLDYIAWLLAQKGEEGLVAEIMATDEVWNEEFFAFQGWVRETVDKNGCVMVPEDFHRRNQDLIDEAWEKGKRELEMIDGCHPFISREEDNAVALPSN